MTPHFRNLKKVLLSEIASAKKTILVAVAWFTDQDVLNLLVEKRKLGLKVVVVVSDDDHNFKRNYSLNFNSLREVGGVVLVVNKAFMHHKFTIIDNALLVTGTANYTYNAFYKNSENLMVINDLETISEFLIEFNSITEFFVFDKSLNISNSNQTIKNEIKWALSQIEYLQQDLTQSEKAIELYEIKYRIRFRSLIFQILSVQNQALERKAFLTNKQEDKLRFEQSQQTLNKFTKTKYNDDFIEDREKDKQTQKNIKQLFREAVKLCHPDNAFISETLKEKAQQIFIKLKEAFSINNLAEVERILEDLKNGIALGNTNYESMNSSSLKDLLANLKKKIQELVKQIYSIKNDKRYLLMLDYEALELHFAEQEILLKERLRSLL